MRDFILPDIGEGIVECELLKWHVAEGDVIVEDQAIADVTTDKATVEIPAMHNGIVAKLYYKEGDIAKVHAPLFALIEEDDKQIIEQSSIEQPEQPTANNTVTESFVLPDIGEGIVECEIVQWHVKAGDTVEEDQAVVEVMTDKAVVEIPAKHNGKILRLHYEKGDIAKVHSPLFDQELVLEQSASEITCESDIESTAQSTSHKETSVKNDVTHNASVPQNTAAVKRVDNKQGEHFEAPIDVGRAIASPAVRRLAKELGVALSATKASGKKGRVLKQDVWAANESSTSGNSSTPSKAVKDDLNDNAATLALGEIDKVEAIKGIRAAMAKQMVASVSTIPHFTVSDELNMDNLIALRSTLKPQFEEQGLKLSFLPFFIKSLSLALLQYPIINSRLNDQASELTYLSSHNIGVAVDGKNGLMVPNIKNVQNLSLFDVAVELNRLIDAARVGKLSNKDLSAGTISISNIGALGGITATPVINKPEVAIVALGKTQKLPRFKDNGEVAAVNMMMLNWSGDHRVIDGATMVKFNNLWMDYLTHPEKMLIHLR